MKFFHFGHQCPHNAQIMTSIQSFATQQQIPFRFIDVSKDHGVCQELRIFSPNMLLINDKHRLHGPFSREKLKAIIQNGRAEPAAYEVKQSQDVVRGDLVPVTPNSVLSACRPCMGSGDESLCKPKSEWVRMVVKSLGLKHLGYLHFCDGVCVGGAEFMPSENVPYPIPDKRGDNAFITCSYLSDESRDYKTHPLMRLIEDLGTWGFRTASIAASRDVVFPNGPLEWYEKRGFVDRGVLIREPLHQAEIHYLQLEIR